MTELSHQASLSERTGPTLCITGVTAAHAKRAVKWMRDRSLLAWHNPADRSINAFEFKQGRAWTDDVMRKALSETRNDSNSLPVWH